MIALIARVISTAGGIGLIRWAPGTCASLATVVAGWFVHQAWGSAVLIALTVFAFVSGLWAVQQQPEKANTDASEIVIDEVAGQLLALWPLSIFLTHGPQPPGSHLLGWFFAFAFFRLFDILKPWPVRLADRRQGAIWIMLDDIIAGVLAGAVIVLAGILQGLAG